jgi:PhnB protein
MSNGRNHIRHGFAAVRPYLYGQIDLPDLIKQAFGAEELERLGEANRGFHIEAKIGDSIVVLEVGEKLPADATRGSVYVYVDDVDGAYRRAIAAGATSIAEPEDKPYDERGAGVRDAFGNIWWMATYKKSQR